MKDITFIRVFNERYTYISVKLMTKLPNEEEKVTKKLCRDRRNLKKLTRDGFEPVLTKRIVSLRGRLIH